MFQTYWSSAFALMKRLNYYYFFLQNYDLLKLRKNFRFWVQDDKLAIDLELCIAITNILKMCACYFEWKWGEIGEEVNIGDGQAQHGGIICVLQTEKISSEWRSSERKEQFKETKIDSVSLSPFMYSNIMVQQLKWEKAKNGNSATGVDHVCSCMSK